MSLEGKTVVITGAAGGIGRAIAERFHRDGARIVAADVSGARLAALADDLEGISTVEVDISTGRGAEAVIAATSGQLDVLVNNAGVSDGLATVDELADEDWDRVLAVNLTSAFLLSRRAVPLMLERGGGVIINMSSVAGLRAGRGGAAYTASKWALVGLTQNIAATLGNEGIRCHAICPGAVSGSITLPGTPLTRRGAQRPGRDRERPPPATPPDVAGVAAFLVSDEAAYLNGVAIPVDAGWIAY